MTDLSPKAPQGTKWRLAFLPGRPAVVRVLATAGIALLVIVGIFGAGFATGWIVSGNIDLSQVAASHPAATPAPTIAGFGSSTLMPDVRGLAPDSAKQVLADAGIDVATVTLAVQPAAGQSGIVIAQTPAFGASAPPTVTLVVSAATVVPSVVGQPVTTAIGQLTKLGAQIKRNSVYVPGAAIGDVVAIDPAPGAALPDIVILRVTAPPATATFASLPASGNCRRSSSIRMNGKDWTDAVLCSVSSILQTGEWSLNKEVDEITGTLGLADSSGTGSSVSPQPVSVQIVADGVVIGTYTVGSGSPTSFTLTTSGRATLALRNQSVSGGSADLVIGDFSARGSSAAITSLTTQ